MKCADCGDEMGLVTFIGDPPVCSYCGGVTTVGDWPPNTWNGVIDPYGNDISPIEMNDSTTMSDIQRTTDSKDEITEDEITEIIDGDEVIQTND